MNQKMERIKKSIDDLKSERDDLREKYNYLVEEMKKVLDKNSQDISSLRNELKNLTGKEVTDESKISGINDEINLLKKTISKTDGKYSILNEKLSENINIIRKAQNSEIKKEINAIKNELVGNMSAEIKKSVKELNELEKNNTKYEQSFAEIKKNLSSAIKSIVVLEGKYDVLKEKLNEKINMEEEALSSEISKRVDDLRSNFINEIKREISESSTDIKSLEKEIKKLHTKTDNQNDSMINVRSMINSLDKSLKKSEGKYSILREKMQEEMKTIADDINLRVSGRVDAMESSMKSDVKDSLSGFKDVKKRITEHDKKLAGIDESMKSIKNAISGMGTQTLMLRKEIDGKTKLLEKEISSEISKVKGYEEILTKDIEDFQKFSSGQRNKIDKFESKISGKIDMFGVDNENMKREFSSLINDFKNIRNSLSELNNKDSELKQHLQGTDLDLENSKKITDEKLSKITEENTLFKENIVAKLNEASEKITSRLAKSEIGSASEIAKQSEEIKLFRAHVTQFINDLVANYEKRFEMMKDSLDQSLKILEERGKEQKAMIFE